VAGTPRITEAELYAELLAEHREPPPPDAGDITVEGFAGDLHVARDRARDILNHEVEAGKLVRVIRRLANGKRISAYRFVGPD
jgi:hypothetical protein